MGGVLGVREHVGRLIAAVAPVLLAACGGSSGGVTIDGSTPALIAAGGTHSCEVEALAFVHPPALVRLFGVQHLPVAISPDDVARFNLCMDRWLRGGRDRRRVPGVAPAHLAFGEGASPGRARERPTSRREDSERKTSRSDGSLPALIRCRSFHATERARIVVHPALGRWRVLFRGRDCASVGGSCWLFPGATAGPCGVAETGRCCVGGSAYTCSTGTAYAACAGFDWRTCQAACASTDAACLSAC